MSDRTPLQLYVYDCPPEQVRAVLDIIHDRGLGLEYEEEGQPDDGQLGLGLEYLDVEAPCGSAEAVAEELRQAAPGATWQVWEDPFFLSLGDIARFTPDLGLWRAECTGDGVAVFTPEQITPLLEGPSREEVRATLGIPHANAIEFFTTKNHGVILDAVTDHEN